MERLDMQKTVAQGTNDPIATRKEERNDVSFVKQCHVTANVFLTHFLFYGGFHSPVASSN